MSDIHILGTIGPFDPSDPYPTHRDIYGHGGYRSVSTIAERDAIPPAVRKEGMAVYVVAERRLYLLGPGLGNADWYDYRPWVLQPPYAVHKIRGDFSKLQVSYPVANHTGPWWVAWYGRFPRTCPLSPPAVPSPETHVHSLLSLYDLSVRIEDTPDDKRLIVSRGASATSYRLCKHLSPVGDWVLLERKADRIAITHNGMRLVPISGSPETDSAYLAALAGQQWIRIAGPSVDQTWNMVSAATHHVCLGLFALTSYQRELLYAGDALGEAWYPAILVNDLLFGGALQGPYDPDIVGMVGDKPTGDVASADDHWPWPTGVADTTTLLVRGRGIYNYDAAQTRVVPMAQAPTKWGDNDPNTEAVVGDHFGQLYVQHNADQDTIVKIWMFCGQPNDTGPWITTPTP